MLPANIFGIKIDLPDGVEAMLAVAGCRADYLPPRFHNGYRIKGSGGFQITDENGACMTHIPLKSANDFETWRRALGAVLDYKRLPQPSMAEAFSSTSSVFGPQ